MPGAVAPFAPLPLHATDQMSERTWWQGNWVCQSDLGWSCLCMVPTKLSAIPETREVLRVLLEMLPPRLSSGILVLFCVFLAEY